MQPQGCQGCQFTTRQFILMPDSHVAKVRLVGRDKPCQGYLHTGWPGYLATHPPHTITLTCSVWSRPSLGKAGRQRGREEGWL